MTAFEIFTFHHQLRRLTLDNGLLRESVRLMWYIIFCPGSVIHYLAPLDYSLPWSLGIWNVACLWKQIPVWLLPLVWWLSQKQWNQAAPGHCNGSRRALKVHVRRGLLSPGSQTLTRHHSAPWKSFWHTVRRVVLPPSGNSKNVHINYRASSKNRKLAIHEP